jgi:hypothetical protein
MFQLLIDDPLITALTQASRTIIKIGDILIMPYDDILDLTYADDEGDVYLVLKGYKYRLRALKYYHLDKIATGNPIKNSWLSLTHEEYDEYCVSPDYGAPLKDSCKCQE